MIKRALLSVGIAVSVGLLATCASVESHNLQAPKYLFDSLLFETHSQETSRANPLALESFRYSLETYRICKGEDVWFEVAPVTTYVTVLPLAGLMPWDSGSIRLFEHATRVYRDPDWDDRDGVYYISYLEGAHSRPSIAGLAYDKTSFAVFPHRMARSHEDEILLHEFGHLLGIPLDPRRHATGHGRHCKNADCVMFHTTSAAKTLCDECVLDIRYLITRAKH